MATGREKTGVTTSHNSGFTLRTLRVLGVWSILRVVTAVAERQGRNRMCHREGCPCTQPATAFTALAYATAAPALQVRKPAGRYTLIAVSVGGASVRRRKTVLTCLLLEGHLRKKRDRK